VRNTNFLGKYQFTESFLHKIDARVKIISVFIVIIFLFFFKSYYSYLVMLILCIFLVISSRVKFSAILSSFRPILFLLFFSVFFQTFFTPGKEVVWQFLFIKITEEGLSLAFYIALRLILLSFFTFILTSTTSTIEIAEGFKKIISPLKFLHFPSDEIALMVSIALQFVPILFEEADRIMKAQMSRGADFNRGSLSQRVKSFLPLVLPLLLNAFNRADQLAIAMESRGFVVGAKRVSYKEKPLKFKDFSALLFILVFCIFLLFMENKGWKIT